MVRWDQAKTESKVTGKMDDLEVFFDLLKNGTTVANFLEERRNIFRFIHEQGLTEDYRLGKGKVKKLRDEVTPVARFVGEHAEPQDQIRFALDDSAPDCRVYHQDGRERQIEVTVAQARERLNLMTELNMRGKTRAYLGRSDKASRKDFDEAMAQEECGYYAHEVAESIGTALAICAENKSRHSGDTLLIEAPLETLAAGRWADFQGRFAEKVRGLRFSEVYITGGSDDRGICLRIK